MPRSSLATLGLGLTLALASAPGCTCEGSGARSGEREGADPAASPPPPSAGPTIDLPALAHVPGDAELIAHVDLGRLLASPLWRENESLMTGDAEARRTLDALVACDLGLERFATIDVAVESRASQVVASVRGDGIGDRERLGCVGERLFGGAADRWAIVDEAGTATIRLDGGAALGHVRGPDQVIFVSQGWDAALRERLAGGGASPAVGPLGEALASLDHARAIWFAGQIPALGGEAENLTSLAGAIDLDAGLALDLTMRAASPAIAAGIRAELDRRLGNIRQRLTKSGLPATASERVTITQEGAALQIRAALEIDEIRAIRRLLAESEGKPAAASERIDQGRPAPAPSP